MSKKNEKNVCYDNLGPVYYIGVVITLRVQFRYNKVSNNHLVFCSHCSALALLIFLQASSLTLDRSSEIFAIRKKKSIPLNHRKTYGWNSTVVQASQCIQQMKHVGRTILNLRSTLYPKPHLSIIWNLPLWVSFSSGNSIAVFI